MKSIFSMSWLRSVQPRKQRKFRHNAPEHVKGEFLNASLVKLLQTKHGVSSIRVRAGDKVKVLRGQFKNTVGLVERVDLSKTRIFVQGAELVKKDGGKVLYPIHPSKVEIQTLVDDKKRFKQFSSHKKSSEVNK
jgi:large subunit ribosomal protein L24